MSWDAKKAISYFQEKTDLYKREYEALQLKPKNQLFFNLQDVTLALYIMNLSCAKAARDIDTLMTAIEGMISLDVADERSNNPAKFLDTISSGAKILKEQLLSRDLSFH